jgi:cell division protein FtsW
VNADHLGAGYQVRQSLIALGSGGISGVGLGNSVQKMFYLPEPHSDFVMAIIGEELGFLGIIGIILLLAALLVTSWRIIKVTQDRFCYFLAFGITFYIIIQALMSIAVITGSMPTKGVPMPFLSYGGSNLIFCWAGCGILANIAGQSIQPKDVKTAEEIQVTG